MRPRIKICCIASESESKMAIAAGASAVGLVAEMPSGPGVIPDDRIAQIAYSLPPVVHSFLLTSRTRVSEIIAHHRLVRTTTIQMVDALSEGSYAELRAALPGIKLVQVIHVLDQASVSEALAIAPQVDALLLDSGNPNQSVKELGGTGRTHNWDLSREICAQAPVPVFLAGGLRPHNVAEAIETVQPFGLDLCSGVRSAGRLDPIKLEAFFKAAWGK